MKRNITIKFKGCALDIEGEFYEETPMLYAYSNGDPGHPGEPPSFEIEQIHYQGKEVTEVIDACNSYVNEQIKELAFKGDIFIELENLCIKEITN